MRWENPPDLVGSLQKLQGKGRRSSGFKIGCPDLVVEGGEADIE